MSYILLVFIVESSFCLSKYLARYKNGKHNRQTQRGILINTLKRNNVLFLFALFLIALLSGWFGWEKSDLSWVWKCLFARIFLYSSIVCSKLVVFLALLLIHYVLARCCCSPPSLSSSHLDDICWWKTASSTKFSFILFAFFTWGEYPRVTSCKKRRCPCRKKSFCHNEIARSVRAVSNLLKAFCLCWYSLNENSRKSSKFLGSFIKMSV